MDGATVDHRLGTPFASSDLITSIRTSLDLTPDLNIRIAAVHRLSTFGAVVTHTANGTSHEGFDAEWREVSLVIADGDTGQPPASCSTRQTSMPRSPALGELQPQARRLENAASQVAERYWAYFESRDWDAMAELLADDVSTEDRRRVVNSGLRKGRNAVCAEISGFAEIGVTEVTSDIIATRGGYLALSRARSWGHDHRPEGFHAEVLHVIEIDAHERIAAILAFDLDDIDASLQGARRPIPCRRGGRCTRRHGQLSRLTTPQSTGAKFLRRRPIGASLTIGRSARSRRVIWPHSSTPLGLSRYKPVSTSRLCIG